MGLALTLPAWPTRERCLLQPQLARAGCIEASLQCLEEASWFTLRTVSKCQAIDPAGS